MKLAKLAQKLGLLFILAIILGLFVPQPAFTQEPVFFKETKHWVTGAFLDYFNSHGSLEIFGYPISEQMVDQGITVQYFQRARMEWHPNNPDPYKVQLGLLGDELKYRQPSIPEPASRSRRKVYFPETGHTLSYAFLDYFQANGGIDLFGYPITEMYFEDGKIVQYFQRLRMEWHPEDTSSTVVIGELGEVYLSIYRDRMLPDALRPQSSNERVVGATPTVLAPDSIKNIRAVVSLRYSVMSKKRNQTVSVLVTDDNGDPLPGAQVAIVFFEQASGQELAGSQATLTTNDQGFAQTDIAVTGGRSGAQIVVRANVAYGTLTTTPQNVFLLWW